MPVIFALWIVNEGLKWPTQFPDAGPVKLPKNWPDEVVFTIADENGFSIPSATPRFVSRRPLLDPNADSVELAESDEYGYWLIEAEATSSLQGRISARVAWRHLQAKEMNLVFHAPHSTEDQARILLRKGEAACRKGKPADAIPLLNQAMELGGRELDDRGVTALVQLGEALRAAGRHAEALEAFEQYLAAWKAKHPVLGPFDELPSAVLMRISQIRKEMATPDGKTQPPPRIHPVHPMPNSDNPQGRGVSPGHGVSP